MFQRIADFEQWWSAESASTSKVMRALTDASLSQAVAPGGRTLGRIAWHIVQTLGEMGGRAGLTIAGASEHTPQPATASAIADAYEANARAVATSVKTSWKDADLQDEVDMYGEKWTRSKALAALVAHEAHHRGQMTVLMRQAGLKVPGVYGPSKEEWTAYGMPVQE